MVVVVLGWGGMVVVTVGCVCGGVATGLGVVDTTGVEGGVIG